MSTPPDRKMETATVAVMLDEAGWRASCDAQWTNLRDLIESGRLRLCDPDSATPSVVQTIVEERARQIVEEGFGPSHDDQHAGGELADAAACYAMTDEVRRHASRVFGLTFKDVTWPFEPSWWKPSPEDRERELVVAAALCIAEIERLRRRKTLDASAPPPTI